MTLTAEEIARFKARGITEVLQSVKATTLVVGDRFVKPISVTGLPSVYWSNAEGYTSLRVDCGDRFEVTGPGKARRLSDGEEFSQELHGNETALKVVAVPWFNDERSPRTYREGLAALSAKRKGVRRHVDWRHIETRQPSYKRPYPINVADGNLLVVEVWSGIPSLVVESGHVEVKFFSSWGNSLDIKPGASARVIVPYGDTKVTINNAGRLSVEAPEKNRVFVHGSGMVTAAPQSVFDDLAEVGQPW